MTVNVNVAVIGDDIEFPSRHFKMCLLPISSRAPSPSPSPPPPPLAAKCAWINFQRMCNIVAFSHFQNHNNKKIFLYIYIHVYIIFGLIEKTGFSVWVACKVFVELQLTTTTTMLYAFGHSLAINVLEMNGPKANLHEFICIILEYLLNRFGWPIQLWTAEVFIACQW